MADTRVSLTRVRLAGRAPRLALIGVALATIAMAAGRTIAPGRTSVGPAVSRPAPAPTTAAEGLAERFARTFMTSVPGEDDVRQRALRDLGLADGSMPLDRGGDQPREVGASYVAAVDQLGGGRLCVTVAVESGAAWTYLAVPVTRKSTGALFIPALPAVVGPPTTATGELSTPEDEVQDAALRQMAGRVVRHYLAGDATDLSADLAPTAAISIPRTSLRVLHVDQVTWVRPRRAIAVGVTARGDHGLQLSLRYVLDVRRSAERWVVQTVVVNPEPKEIP